MVDNVRHNRKKPAERVNIGLCLVCSLPVLGLFLFISLYNHPIGDDFWCTSLVRKYGYWPAQVMLYDIVPPRYLELALSCLTPLSFGNFSGYKIIPAAFILLFIYVVAGFFKTLAGWPSYRKTFLPAVLFVSLYLCVLPGLAEGIYWVSALSVYHTGILLTIVWFNYLMKWYYVKRNAYYFIVIILCLAGMFGCNELVSIVAVIILSSIFLHKLFRKKEKDILLIVQLLLSVVWLCFVARYKGVSNRYAGVATKGSGRIFYSIGYALLTDVYYIGRVLINPFFWAIALAGHGLFRKMALLSPVLQAILRFRVLFLTIWGVVLFIIPFMIVYLSGDRPPLRICNLIIFYFLLGLLVVTAESFQIIKVRTPRKMFIPVMGFAIAGLILPNNVSLVAKDFYRGKASEYDKAWDRRIELIQQCKADTCIVPPLKEIPFAFSFEPDGDEPHISEYFNKKIIVR